MPTEVRPCSRCGAQNEVGFGACVRCGASLVDGAPAPRKAIQVDLSPQATRQWARLAFAVLIAAVFVGQLVGTLQVAGKVPLLSSGAPRVDLRFGAMVVDWALVSEEPFRLLSAVFVHFGLLHFGMNGFVYWDLSRVAETFVGSARFAIAFVATGVVGFAATVAVSLLTKSPPALTAGASGAIFGLMGVVLGVLFARKDPHWKSFAGRAVLYSVVFGFAVNATSSAIAVNNAAHLGGLVTGVLFGLATRTPPRSGAIERGLGVLAFVVSVASVVLALLSTLPEHLTR